MAEDISQGTKRPIDRTQSPGPLPKSPRTSSPPAVLEEKQAEGQDSAHVDVTPGEPMSEACAAPELSPRSRRKSWRRSTRGRASLPALLSTDASQRESTWFVFLFFTPSMQRERERRCHSVIRIRRIISG